MLWDFYKNLKILTKAGCGVSVVPNLTDEILPKIKATTAQTVVFFCDLAFPVLKCGNTVLIVDSCKTSEL